MHHRTIIRKGNRADLKEVYDLVVELAIYEKAPDAVSASLEDYYNAFDSGAIDILVATEAGSVLGMALYYNTFSTWKGKMYYLEDFVVKENHRGRGIGAKLFEAFLDDAKQNNCKLVKWQVLDWNQPAINFYEKYGTRFQKEWLNVLLDF